MHNKKLFGTATVGTKGQIVIPADARDELGITPGDRLYVIGSPKAGAVTFIKEEQLNEFIERLNINIENFKKHRRNRERQ
jgi:AbrB family looped-hinge helix DNA binding protein